jgi:hypothetical protein
LRGIPAHTWLMESGLHSRRRDAASSPLALWLCEGYVNDTHQHWGHVGVSLGDGRVVHGWSAVRIDEYRAIEQLTPPPHWTPPVYIGWTPAEQLLQGCKPRHWEPSV